MEIKRLLPGAEEPLVSPKLLALRKATELIKSLDERTEDLEAGATAPQEEHLEALSECVANWRVLSHREIKQLPKGCRVQLRQADDQFEALKEVSRGVLHRFSSFFHRFSMIFNGLEVILGTQLVAAGEPGTLYRLWEVSTPELECLGIEKRRT